MESKSSSDEEKSFGTFGREFTGNVNTGTPCVLKILHDDAISYP